MKQKLLLVGCGDIALRAASLLRPHYKLLGLCRRPENYGQLRLHGIIPVSGDLDNPKSLCRLAGLAHAVLHLAPPTNHGKRDMRTTNLLVALTKRSTMKEIILPQRFVYISTSGVYGDCNGSLIDETCSINPLTERSMRRVDAEMQLRNWGLRNRVRVSILRVPGIYAADRLPLTRLRKNTPMLLPEEDCYTNCIHADDLVRIIFAALRHARPGRIYHACDDSRIKMGEYFDLIADQFNIPRVPRVARANADQHISANMLSYMEESRQLMNIRIKNELRVNLRYPTVLEGIAACKTGKLENR